MRLLAWCEVFMGACSDVRFTYGLREVGTAANI